MIFGESNDAQLVATGVEIVSNGNISTVLAGKEIILAAGMF